MQLITSLGLFFLSFALGLLLVQLVWRLATERFPSWMLSVFLGAGVGAGVSSVLFTGDLFLRDATPVAPPTFLWVEAGLLLALLAGWVFLRRRGTPAPASSGGPVRLQPLFLLLCAAGFAGALIFFLQSSALRPVGDWDGWTLWDLHAKFLAFGGAGWKKIFTEPLHPDYPLLTSGFIARAWAVLGRDQTLVPIYTAALFLFGSIGLLMAVLKELRGWQTALLGGLILACSTGYTRLGADQYADVPVGFYFLAALGLLLLHDLRFPEKSLLFLLVGLCAGFALWTKNEGWLMLAALVFVRVSFQLRSRSFRKALPEWGFFLAGLAPLLLITLYYRSLAPANDMTAAPWKSLAQLADLSRYATVWNNLNQYLVALGKWKSGSVLFLLALFGLGMGLRLPAAERAPLALAGLTILVLVGEYFLTYILTPRDLLWHLQTSLDRLLMQFFPALLALIFLSIHLEPEKS